MDPYIRAGILENFRATAESFGADPDALLREADVSPQATMIPGIYLPYANYRRLLHCAARATGAPHFALAMMRSASAETLGTTGIIMTQADSVREAWLALSEFYRIHDTYGQVDLDEGQGGALLSYRIPRNDLPGTRQVYDAAAGLANNIMRQFCGVGFRALEFSMPYPQPQDLECFAGLGAEHIRFGAPAMQMRFDPLLLEHRLTGRSDELRSLLDQHFLNRGLGIPVSTSRKVEDLIRRLLPTGDCTLAMVAETLSVAVRTLQAQLDEEQSSFRQLLERVRREIATYHLRRGDMPLTHLAMILGYSELSAFSRSFRRWYGVSPSQWADSIDPAPAGGS